MLKRWSVLLLILVSFVYATPVSENGRLKVIGTQLHNQYDYPIQLRGVDGHGIQWFRWGQCANTQSLDWLRDEWDIDVYRVTLYVEEGGYLSDPQGQTAQLKTIVDEVTSRGIYAIVDWHVHGFDPNRHIAEARTFWNEMVDTYAGREDVIFELANEPNDCTWADVKSYSEEMIDIIRAHDPDILILVGTPSWSSDLSGPANNPLTGARAHNIMYIYHHYSSMGHSPSRMTNYIGIVPIFVTEWGTDSSYLDEAQEFINIMGGDNNENEKISWVAWSFSDDGRGISMLNSGTCPNGPWDTSSLTAPGRLFMDNCMYPPDDFGSVLSCTDQGFYCCPSGYTCSQPEAGTGCITGETCCASQNNCFQSGQSCADQGYYCCPVGYTCSQPRAGSCSSGACCESQSYCSQAPLPSAETRIARWKGDKGAAFSMNFDDSSTSQATIAIPRMIERGVVGSFYCNPDHSSWYDYPEVWTGTAITSGQELAGHTMTHGDWNGNKIIEDYANAEWEIGENARIIWEAYENIYSNHSRLHSWCSPGGGIEWRITDAEMAELMDRYHFVWRDYVTCAVTGESAHSLYSKYVQPTLDRGDWGGVCFHGIEGMNYAPVSEADFVDFLDRLVAVEDELWVGTNIAVHKYIQERDTANLQVLEATAQQIRISLTTAMDPTLYDEPLTLITEVSWSEVDITHDGRTWTEPANSGEVMYNVRPDRGDIILVPAGGGQQSYCGDSICQAGEDCNSCEVDCGECEPVCIPMTTAELSVQIANWKQGNISMAQLMDYIAEWKRGC